MVQRSTKPMNEKNGAPLPPFYIVNLLALDVDELPAWRHCLFRLPGDALRYKREIKTNSHNGHDEKDKHTQNDRKQGTISTLYNALKVNQDFRHKEMIFVLEQCKTVSHSHPKCSNHA